MGNDEKVELITIQVIALAVQVAALALLMAFG